MDEPAIDAVIQAQLGRPTRGRSLPVSQCPLSLPVVVSVPPILDDGTPFPTRFWLSCPLAHRRIARLEAAGEVRAWEARLADDPKLAAAMDAAHQNYAALRTEAAPDEAKYLPRGGVAGLTRGGIKCLHAHYAHARAGGENPVGKAVQAAIEPLNCTTPCVSVMEGSTARNSAWREPPLDSDATTPV
ncbi:MAG: DUF501 domain-containing protein [Myxococcota bacterium]